MVESGKSAKWAAAIAVFCIAVPTAAHAAVAGHVQFVSGNVQIIAQTGSARAALKGDAINEGDTLVSASKSTAQIKMQDGGFLAVRPDTRLKFDQFVFAGKEDGNEKSFFSLFKGGFRAVTGLIGRINKQNYRISTPAATIGVRGTDHETVVVVPNGNVAPPGTYNMVNIGETSMTTDAGTINIRPGSGMAYSPGMSQAPVVMPVNTLLFDATKEPSPAETPETGGQDDTGSEPQTQDGNAPAGQGDGTELAAGEATEPIRETAVVDATPPGAGAAATPAPVADAGGTGAMPAAPQVTLDVGGQVVNLTNQTIPLTAPAPVLNVMNGLPAQGSVLGVLIQNTSPTTSGMETWYASSRLLTVNFDAAGIQSILNWCGGCGVNSTHVERIAIPAGAGGTGVAAASFDAGADVGVVTWGRWSGGDTTFGGWGPVTLGPDQGFHFVAGTQTAALPTTVVPVRYNLIGATAPTNNLVAGLTTGPVTASGFVDVNFGAQTTSTQMNIASGNAAFQIVASGAGFTGADFTMNGTTTRTGGTAPFCTAACPTNIVGSFYGAGATHVGLAYRASAVNSGGGVIDGAAVFK